MYATWLQILKNGNRAIFAAAAHAQRAADYLDQKAAERLFRDLRAEPLSPIHKLT